MRACASQRSFVIERSRARVRASTDPARCRLLTEALESTPRTSSETLPTHARASAFNHRALSRTDHTLAYSRASDPPSRGACVPLILGGGGEAGDSSLSRARAHVNPCASVRAPRSRTCAHALNVKSFRVAHGGYVGPRGAW